MNRYTIATLAVVAATTTLASSDPSSFGKLVSAASALAMQAAASPARAVETDVQSAKRAF